MAHDVFISYAGEDIDVADRLCRALEAEGIRCWMAPRDATLGRDYEKSIMDAIKVSPFLVLVFSRHSNASPHVEREIRKAFKDDSSTEVFPFRLENIPYNQTLDYYLGSAHWLDASAPPLENHLRRLVEHVRAHLRRPDGKLPAYHTEVAPLPSGQRKAHPLAMSTRLLLAAIAGVLLVSAAAYQLSGSWNTVSNNSAVAPYGNENSVAANSNGGNANDAADDNRNTSTPMTPTPTPTPGASTPTPERNSPTPTPQTTPTTTSTPAPREEQSKSPADDRIEDLVERVLWERPEFRRVGVSSRAGAVTLTGTIYTDDEDNFAALVSVAERKALGVPGVKGVTTRINRGRLNR